MRHLVSRCWSLERAEIFVRRSSDQNWTSSSETVLVTGTVIAAPWGMVGREEWIGGVGDMSRMCKPK